MRVAVVQALGGRVGGVDAGHSDGVRDLGDGGRAPELGDRVRDAHALAPFRDADLLFEDRGRELEEDVACDFLVCKRGSVRFSLSRGIVEAQEDAPINLSHTPWSNPRPFNHSTTSSSVHSLGCVLCTFELAWLP